jgi:hypothetical protein
VGDEIPQRWPLVTNPGNRYSAIIQDGKLVNAYAEKDQQMNEYNVYRRPGMRPYEPFETIAGLLGRGIFQWSPDLGASYIMQVRSSGTASIYKDLVALDTVEDGDYDAFEPVASSTPTLFFKTGGFAYTTDGTTVTPVTDLVWVGFAADVMPGAASLNGRLYVLVAPNKVYGATNLNDGTVWSSLNLILANDGPDWGTYITRYLQYILVLKTWTTEVFQDVGNPTGSPLGRVPGVTIPYGCLATDTVKRVGDDLYWVAVSLSSSQSSELKQVVRMRGLQPQIVSTPQVDRLLAAHTIGRAFYAVFNSHQFYCVGLLTEGEGYFYLVYDITENLWSEWTFPKQIRDVSADIFQMTLGKPLQIIQSLTHDVTDEDPSSITMDIYTPNMDFGVDYVKTLWALYFTSDQTKSTICQVRHSDDDYQTWSNFRTVNLGLKKPCLHNEGTFYRRAYHIRFTQVGPIRMRALGMQMDLGTM